MAALIHKITSAAVQSGEDRGFHTHTPNTRASGAAGAKNKQLKSTGVITKHVFFPIMPRGKQCRPAWLPDCYSEVPAGPPLGTKRHIESEKMWKNLLLSRDLPGFVRSAVAHHYLMKWNVVCLQEKEPFVNNHSN